MKTNTFSALAILFFLFIPQIICAQTTSDASIISSDLFFLRTVVTKSNTGPMRGGVAAMVITTHKNDYYSLRLSIRINHNIDTPLEVRLTPPGGRSRIYHLEQSMEPLRTNWFYEYNREIILSETGRYKIEIGNFSKNKNRQKTNLVFDERFIYVSK